MKCSDLKKIIKDETGASILESMIAIMLLCLIFFGVMQVFSFAMDQMVCRYAAFNGAKAWSLGYTPRITEKTVRLSAMGISGKDYSKPTMRNLSKYSLKERMQQYMMSGNADVDFEYWQNKGCATCSQASGTQLKHSISSKNGAEVRIQVRLEHAPMLTDGIGGLLHMGFDDASVRSTYSFYNHSYRFLK